MDLVCWNENTVITSRLMTNFCIDATEKSGIRLIDYTNEFLLIILKIIISTMYRNNTPIHIFVFQHGYSN